MALLLGFDSGVTDESSHLRAGSLVQSSGIPVRTTAQAKFGTHSLEHNHGSTGRLTYADDTEFPSGTTNFTIEGWFRRKTASTAAREILVAQWDEGTSQRSWLLRTDSSGAQMDFRLSSDGVNPLTKLSAFATLDVGTWHHIATDWDGTKYRLYKDGVTIASATGAVSLHNSTADVSILHQISSGVGLNPFEGYADEVRITTGVARYANDIGFTVPATAFPRS
ncbi:MAG: LamG domain-containing protein [Pseudomonadota bacterium]